MGEDRDMDAMDETAVSAGEPSRHAAAHRAAMRRFVEAAWGGAEAAHSSWYPPARLSGAAPHGRAALSSAGFATAATR